MRLMKAGFQKYLSSIQFVFIYGAQAVLLDLSITRGR